ncbi:MAG: hypothetical protein JXR53_13900, partial [Bacteroidales bacterium]|nr:hypothetical protein [Bacteroidales bacterium]
ENFATNRNPKSTSKYEKLKLGAAMHKTGRDDPIAIGFAAVFVPQNDAPHHYSGFDLIEQCSLQ